MKEEEKEGISFTSKNSEKPKSENLIDGRYEIVERFGASSELYKMVFLVRDINTTDKERVVLKLYTPQESEEFLKEVEKNSMLINCPQILKLRNFVAPHDKLIPFTYNGFTFDHYSYLILPYC